MIQENKRKLAHILLLSFCIYLTPQTTISQDDQDIDIVNEAIYKKEHKKQIKTQPKKAKTSKETSKKVEKPQVDDISTKEFPKDIDYSKRLSLHEEKRKINNIHVIGNKVITKDSIISKLPLKVGDIFSVNYTAGMIKNLYKLGYFHQVKIYAESIGDDQIDLYVVVEEKPRFKEATFTGNKAVTSKELNEELKISTVATLVKEELTALISKIKKLYQKKNYHNTQVTGTIVPLEKGQVSATFDIKEGKKSYLTRISFKGNQNVSSKRLKRIIFSKEDWVLGMIDRSGTYNPEMIEGDKAMIEDGYKSNGFINAKVTDVDVEKDRDGNFHITFTVHEGERYMIKSVEAPGNDILSEDQLKMVIPVFPGQWYSVEKIRTALENLKLIWGEHGYIFADIEPIIDTDDEKKVVTIKFQSDLKNQVYLNRLTIKGNQKSKDKIIRRIILLDEGELISNQKMDVSKSRVSLLNYFDQKDGVSWKTTRIDDTHADLDLILREVKTGHFQFNLGYGGSPTNKQTPQTGLNFNCSTGDRNLFGSGVAGSLLAEISKKYRAFNATIMNPWLFDKPIRGNLNGYIKKFEDENFKIAKNSPLQQSVGGVLGLGYMIPRLNGILLEGQLHYERITFDRKIEAAGTLTAPNQSIAQSIINKNFQEGSQVTFGLNINQDKRNGAMFATNGHQWNWLLRLTVPGSRETCDSEEESSCETPNNLQKNSRFQYFKSEFDVSWYTPLIGEHDLVLGIHANAGFIYRFKDKDVPWRDLYHIGGPTSVRGYTFGQVGPSWHDTSLGSKKGFNVNVEFTTPLSSNLNTRGVIFYDGGAGWDTPYFDELCAQNKNFGRELKNNNFFYRHSVGIGIRIKSPSPMQVDFGIKLNPAKMFKKELTQLHLSVEHQF